MNELRYQSILAISGGADSMYLLHQYRHQSNIVVAHVNYNIRIDSGEDEQLVSNYCNQYNIPFRSISVHKPDNVNLEEWARNVRYDFFKDLLNEFKYEWIITAHNADDQAETVLMRIQRGTGVKGLSGIIIDRKPFYRPMLSITKTDVYKYCKLNNVPFREDSTNTDTTYRRNWFRHVYIPSLEDREASVSMLCRIAELSQKVSDKILNHSHIAFDSVVTITGNKITIPKTVVGDALFFTYLQDLLSNYNINLSQTLFNNIFSSDPSLNKITTKELIINKRKIRNIELILI